MLTKFCMHLCVIHTCVSNLLPGILDYRPLPAAISLWISRHKFQLFPHDSKIGAVRSTTRSREGVTGSTAAPSIEWTPPGPISAGHVPIPQNFYFSSQCFRKIRNCGATPRSLTLFQKMHRLGSLHGWVSNPYEQQTITTPLQGGRAAWIFRHRDEKWWEIKYSP